MNNVVLVGRLTKDPELTYVGDGKAKARFTIAVKGFNEEDTDFLTCVAWDKTAENTANFVRKGHRIAVQGNIKTRNWESEKGRVYITEILCNKVDFLEPKPQEEERPKKEQYKNQYQKR
jgi:single-strand DNA-binding protein